MKLFMALFASLILMTGCATTQTKFSRPLESNEARIFGRTGSLINTSSVIIARIDDTPKKLFQQELIIPAGKVRLRLRYNDRSGPFQSILNETISTIEEKYDKEVQVEVIGGHEYYVDCIIRTLVIGFGDIDYRITDNTTGLVIVETKGKKE
jgi:hypothetical protein